MKRMGQEQESLENCFKDRITQQEQEMLAKATREKADLESMLMQGQQEKEHLIRDDFSKEPDVMQQ